MKIMRMHTVLFVALLAFSCTPDSPVPPQQQAQEETREQRDQRMQWWREARFGMFIHWGLYAIPAGEWKGRTDYGEWIRHTAETPLANTRPSSHASIPRTRDRCSSDRDRVDLRSSPKAQASSPNPCTYLIT
jgi:hypothetical protein